MIFSRENRLLVKINFKINLFFEISRKAIFQLKQKFAYEGQIKEAFKQNNKEADLIILSAETQEYLNKNSISKENFEKNFDIELMIESEIRKKQGNLDETQFRNYINNLKARSRDIQTVEELKQLQKDSNLTAHERILIEISWVKGVQRKIDNLQCILTTTNLPTEKITEKAKESDALRGKIMSIINPNSGAPSVSNSDLTAFETLEKIDKEILQKLKDAMVSNATSPTYRPFTEKEREQMEDEKTTLLHQIGDRNRDTNPELPGLISEYLDTKKITDEVSIYLPEGSGMRKNLEKKQKDLQEMTVPTQQRLAYIKSYAYMNATIKSRVDTEKEETFGDMYSSGKKNVLNFCREIKRNLIDNPRTPGLVKLGALALSVYGVVTLLTSESPFIVKLKKVLKGAGIIGGIGIIGSYALTGKGLSKTIEKYFDEGSKEGEMTGEDTLSEIFSVQKDEKKLSKKEYKQRIDSLSTVLSSNNKNKAINVVKAYNLWSTGNKKNPMQLNINGVSDENATKAIELFFSRYKIKDLEKKYGVDFKALQDLTFPQLAFALFTIDDKLTHEGKTFAEQKVDQIVDVAKGVYNWTSYHAYYAGIKGPILGIQYIDSTEKDVAQANHKAHVQAQVPGSTTGTSVGGIFDKAKEKVEQAGAWVNQFWGVEYIIPDKYIEEKENANKIKNALELRQRDYKFSTSPEGESIDFVRTKMPLFEKKFINPLTPDKLDPFYLDMDANGSEYACYATAKVEYDPSNPEKGIKDATKKAKDKAKEEYKNQTGRELPQNYLDYTQFINAVSFAQTETDPTKQEIRIFIRIPLGLEYAHIRRGDGESGSKQANELSKLQEYEVLRLEAGNFLTLDTDFKSEDEKLLLLEKFPVERILSSGRDTHYAINLILKYLSEDFTKNRVGIKRQDAKDRILKTSLTEIEDIVNKVNTKYGESITFIFKNGKLLKYQDYEQRITEVEEKVISKKFDSFLFGPKNPEPIKKHFRETVIKKNRALYQLALVSLENRILNRPSPNYPLADIIPQQAKRDAITGKVDEIINDKALLNQSTIQQIIESFKLNPKTSMQRTPQEIIDVYETFLMREATRAIP